MSTVNRARLLAIAEQEFRRETAAPDPMPAPSRFGAIRLKLARYDATWDRKRGAAARLMAVLLREDDTQLTQRVCESDSSSRTYAAGRLRVVLQRCGEDRSSDGARQVQP